MLKKTKRNGKKFSKKPRRESDSYVLYNSRSKLSKHTSGLGNNNLRYDPFQIQEILDK